MAVVNAANRQKAVEFLSSRLNGDVTLEDISATLAQIALQGPISCDILSKLTTDIPDRYYTFVQNFVVSGVHCLISRTGYTGEHAGALWDALMEAGKDDGLIPCGLAARDTLRLEAGMPLYGHEMDDGVSPFETNLGFAVKMTKDDFIGKSALISRGAPEITRVGLKVTGRGIARERCPVFLGEDKIGETTSGTYLPYLKGAYAMALIRRTGAIPGNQVTIGIPKTHEWVEYITENTARIGLTDFAREALGSLVFVNLPQEGDSLSTGEGFGEVDRYDLDYSAVPFHS